MIIDDGVGFTGLYLAVLCFIGLKCAVFGLYWASLGCIGLYLAVLDWTGLTPPPITIVNKILKRMLLENLRLGG